MFMGQETGAERRKKRTDGGWGRSPGLESDCIALGGQWDGVDFASEWDGATEIARRVSVDLYFGINHISIMLNIAQEREKAEVGELVRRFICHSGDRSALDAMGTSRVLEIISYLASSILPPLPHSPKKLFFSQVRQLHFFILVTWAPHKIRNIYK